MTMTTDYSVLGTQPLLDPARYSTLMHASWLVGRTISAIASLLHEPERVIAADISMMSCGQVENMFRGRPANWKPSDSLSKLAPPSLSDIDSSLLFQELSRRQVASLVEIWKFLEDCITERGWAAIEDLLCPGPAEYDEADASRRPRM